MLFKSAKSVFDYLIVGLGNPGIEYEKTRHNAGFMAIDKLSDKCGCKIDRAKFESLYADTVISGKRVMLLKPQTYMNNSGRAVSAVSSFYKIPYDKIIVLFDDISLDVGNIRIRRKGSAGGHNGIKDIIELLGTEDIMRIKIGVGQKPNKDYNLADWVLSKLPANLAEDFDTALDNAAKATESIVKNGIDKAMNAYSK